MDDQLRKRLASFYNGAIKNHLNFFVALLIWLGVLAYICAKMGVSVFGLFRDTLEDVVKVLLRRP